MASKAQVCAGLGQPNAHGEPSATTQGGFGTTQAFAPISLDFLHEMAKARSLDRVVLPLGAGLDDIPAFPVSPEEADHLAHGGRLMRVPAMPGLCCAMLGDRPVALVEARDGVTVIVRGFNL